MFEKLTGFKEDIEPKYFWSYINSDKNKREWNNINAILEEFCYKFTCINDYGDSLFATRFNFIIKKKVELFKQEDNVSTSTYLGIPKQTNLSLNIDFEEFEKSEKDTKLKILAVGILYLLKYWKEHLKTPKGVPLEKIIVDYENYLKINNQYFDYSKSSNIYLKANNYFRINFNNYLLKDIKKKDILFDIEKMENYLNQRLNDISFGKSITKLYFSYDLFDFYSPKTNEYKDDEKKYLYGRNKDLSIMEQFDTNLILYQSYTEQLEYFRDGILDSILRIKKMKRKPKYLDISKLHFEFNRLLNEYIKTTANNGYS